MSTLAEKAAVVRAGIRIHPDEPTDVMVTLELNALAALDALLAECEEAEIQRREATASAEREIRRADLALEEMRRELSICAYCGVGFKWDNKGDSCPGCARVEKAERTLAEMREALEQILALESKDGTYEVLFASGRWVPSFKALAEAALRPEDTSDES